MNQKAKKVLEKLNLFKKNSLDFNFWAKKDLVSGSVIQNPDPH